MKPMAVCALLLSLLLIGCGDGTRSNITGDILVGPELVGSVSNSRRTPDTIDDTPVGNATVQVFQNGNLLFQTTSDGSGGFSVNGLLAGDYNVNVSAPGLIAQSVLATIQTGQQTTLIVILDPI